MNVANFVVRPHRRAVEKYKTPEAWTTLLPENLAEMAHEAAGLPSELPADDEAANSQSA